MRAFVIALVIALLPLRGWVGDAMAAEVALAAVQARSSNASPLHIECAAHNDSPLADSPQTGDCNACQVCHTVAMQATPVLLAQVDMPTTAVPLVASRFASAERALSVKPPIA